MWKYEYARPAELLWALTSEDLQGSFAQWKITIFRACVNQSDTVIAI